MTRAFIPLLKNNFKVMFGLSSDFKEKRKQLLLYLLLAVLTVPILIMMCYGVYQVAKLATPDVLSGLIASIMFASEIVVLFFGVMSSLSVLFFSKDNELLLALPVTGLDIFLSKFITVYLLHVGLALLIQLPIILTLGIGVAIKDIGYYILGFIGSLLTPFIPLFIISILAVPIGYLVSYFKRNNVVGTIIVLLLFGGFFAGYYYLIFAMQGSIGENGIDMVAFEKAMKIMSYIIYPNTYIATSMLTSGLEAFKNFAIFFAIIAGLAVISIAISTVLYKGGARRGLEGSGAKNGKAKDNQVVSVPKALLGRDLKNCMASTSNAINYLMGLVLSPIVMIMLSFVYGQGEYPVQIMNLCASMLALIFGCGMNYFAIVSFSIEGRQIDVLRMLPVPAKTIIKQKISLACCYTIVIDCVLLASMFIAKVNYVTTLMLFVIALIGGFGTNILCVYNDLKSPNFVWNNAKELFKNNSKSLFSMLFSLPLVLIASAGVLIIDLVYVDAFESQNLANFVALAPALALAIAYAVVAGCVVYPKLEKMYECLEI